MPDETIPGAGQAPAPGPDAQHGAELYHRAMCRIAHQYGYQATGDRWADLPQASRDLMAAGMATVLAWVDDRVGELDALRSQLEQAQTLAIRVTSERDRAEGRAEDLAVQLIAAEEALAIAHWHEVPIYHPTEQAEQ